MTDRVQWHLQHRCQAPGTPQSGKECRHITVFPAPGLIGHSDGTNAVALERRTQPFHEFRQITRMLVDHMGLGETAAATGYSQDTPFILYDTAIVTEKADRRSIAACVDSQIEIHTLLLPLTHIGT